MLREFFGHCIIKVDFMTLVLTTSQSGPNEKSDRPESKEEKNCLLQSLQKPKPPQKTLLTCRILIKPAQHEKAPPTGVFFNEIVSSATSLFLREGRRIIIVVQ